MKNRINKAIFVFIFILGISWFCIPNRSSKSYSNIQSIAAKIKRIRYKSHPKVKVEVIEGVLRSSVNRVKERFPNGPFTPKDLVAIAIVETDFSQYAIGTHGERGIYQILNYNGELSELGLSGKDIFDLDVNTQALCNELVKKYKKHRNYKNSIIAYNGWYRLENGKIYTGYWDRFSRARIFVDNIWIE